MKRFNTDEQRPAKRPRYTLQKPDTRQETAEKGETNDLQSYGAAYAKRQLAEAIARLSSPHKPDPLTEPTPDIWPVAVTAVMHQLTENTARTRQSYHPNELNALRTLPWIVSKTTLPTPQLEAHALLYSLATREFQRTLRQNNALQATAATSLQTLTVAWQLQDKSHHSVWLISTLLTPLVGKLISHWTILLHLALYDRIARAINNAK